MVTCSDLKNHKLGNSLFMFAATMVHASRVGALPGFTGIPFLEMLEQPPSAEIIPVSKIPSLKYSEPSFSYRKIPDFSKVDLLGYFQSEKYFSGSEDFIRSELYPNKALREYCKKHSLPNSCSIHVRRTDYLNFPDVFHVLDKDYVVRAIDEIGRDKTFFIFSDDVAWCQENLTGLSGVKTIYPNGSKYEDFWLQSACTHHIIGNSSFSWWAAWLSEGGGKVIAPKKWFREKGPQDDQDLIPDRWIRV